MLGVASANKCSPDYVPTLNMGYEKHHKPSSSTARYEQGLKREVFKDVERQEYKQIAAESLLLDSDVSLIDKGLPTNRLGNGQF